MNNGRYDDRSSTIHAKICPCNYELILLSANDEVSSLITCREKCQKNDISSVTMLENDESPFVCHGIIIYNSEM